MSAAVSIKQKDLMRHALGLSRGKQEYRNHFVASNGTPNCREWQSLEKMGLATSKEYGGAPRSTIFFVTDAGRRAAISKAEPHHPHTADKVTQGGKSE